MEAVDARQEIEHKRFEAADETREFPNGRVELLRVGGGEVGRCTFEPGWRWSDDWHRFTTRRAAIGLGWRPCYS